MTEHHLSRSWTAPLTKGPKLTCHERHFVSDHKPLKVLCITTIDLSAWCFLRSWFRTLRSHGAEVTLACTVERFRDDLEQTGATVLHLPISRRIEPLKDLASFLDLVYLIRRLKPDVVHSGTSKAGFVGRLAARLCGVPVVLHTIWELPENSVNNRFLKKVYWLLEYAAAKFSHHLITISKPNYQQIIAEHICRPEKLSLIAEGLDLSRCVVKRSANEVRAEFALAPEAVLIGTVGRLEAAKGHGDLLEAFALVRQQCNQAYLMVVGHGELRTWLENKANQLGISQYTIFTGWREDLYDLMNAFDVYTLASHYEGQGVATMEAMVLGRPVVCTGVGGVLDIVTDGHTGLLVPPHRPDLLAKRLLEIINSPEKAAQMCQQARQHIESNYSDEVINQKRLDLYNQLTGGRLQ